MFLRIRRTFLTDKDIVRYASKETIARLSIEVNHFSHLGWMGFCLSCLEWIFGYSLENNIDSNGFFPEDIILPFEIEEMPRCAAEVI